MRADTFTVRQGRHAGEVLNQDSWFRLTSEPGALFSFRCFDVGPRAEWVSAYGGDPHPEGRRQFRYFRTDLPFIPAPAPRRKK